MQTMVTVSGLERPQLIIRARIDWRPLASIGREPSMPLAQLKLHGFARGTLGGQLDKSIGRGWSLQPTFAFEHD